LKLRINGQETYCTKGFIECPKCAKTHLRAYVISKNFPGVIPRTPIKKVETERRGGEGRGGREGGKGRIGKGRHTGTYFFPLQAVITRIVRDE
jgi:hypothetical protein